MRITSSRGSVSTSSITSKWNRTPACDSPAGMTTRSEREMKSTPAVAEPELVDKGILRPPGGAERPAGSRTVALINFRLPSGATTCWAVLPRMTTSSVGETDKASLLAHSPALEKSPRKPPVVAAACNCMGTLPPRLFWQKAKEVRAVKLFQETGIPPVSRLSDTSNVIKAVKAAHPEGRPPVR